MRGPVPRIARTIHLERGSKSPLHPSYYSINDRIAQLSRTKLSDQSLVCSFRLNIIAGLSRVRAKRGVYSFPSCLPTILSLSLLTLYERSPISVSPRAPSSRNSPAEQSLSITQRESRGPFLPGGASLTLVEGSRARTVYSKTDRS